MNDENKKHNVSSQTLVTPPFKNRSFKIPSGYCFIYDFKGVVHPQRASVELYDLGIAKIKCITRDQNFPGFLEVVGKQGELWARFHFDQQIKDFLMLKNLLRSHLEARIDLLCYLQGTIYNVEIVSCTPFGSDELFFGVELPAIKELADKNTKRVNAVELFKHECFPYLSLAINDFKNAMQNPNEASYLAFRAIESLRVYYADLNKIDLEAKGGVKKSWELLRRDLKYAESDFENITKHAIARRHGQRSFQTEQENLNHLKLAWEVIYRFQEARFGSAFITPAPDV
ncbi:MAG: hypothetical protein ACXVCY_16345 [Pseudobdellovibrionaceae bacterium]